MWVCSDQLCQVALSCRSLVELRELRGLLLNCCDTVVAIKVEIEVML